MTAPKQEKVGDFSNRTLDKRIRLDLVVAILCTSVPLVITGVYGYGQMSSQLETVKEKVQEEKAKNGKQEDKIDATNDKLSQIKLDVNTIKGQVSNLGGDVENITKKQEAMDKKLDRALILLERN